MTPEPAPEGARERRRRETHARIAQTGLQLFLEHGYEATTLDAIAAAAGISRRTFFSYFRSKDEILLAVQDADWTAVIDDLLAVSPDEDPLTAIQSILVRHAAAYESESMVAIDQVMRASATLAARKQVAYAQHEEELYAALCQVWRRPERRPGLRIVAMAAMGAMRLALEAWQTQDGDEPVTALIDRSFATLREELG